MIIIFKLIILVTIWVLGIKIATAEGMILERLGNWAADRTERYKILEALIVCPWCMPSLHSIVGYGFAFGLGILPFEWNWQLVIRYPIIVMGASLLSGVTWTLIETLNRIKEKYDNDLTRDS